MHLLRDSLRKKLAKRNNSDYAEKQAGLVFDAFIIPSLKNIQNLIASGGPSQMSQHEHERANQLRRTK